MKGTDIGDKLLRKSMPHNARKSRARKSARPRSSRKVMMDAAPKEAVEPNTVDMISGRKEDGSFY